MADQPGGGDGGDNIIIRTMKDDLGSRDAKPPTSPVGNPVTSEASFTGPAAFPLPPRGTAPIPPTVPAPFRSTPNVTRRNRRRLMVWLGGVLAAIILIGGGAWAFITFVSAPAPAEETLGTSPAPVSDLLPASAGLAIYYSFETPADRSRLLELWQNSPKTLLQGNPKTLISDPKIEQFMYVGIPGESRPFLIIPKDQVSAELVEQLSPEQIFEKSGWVIFHALNVSPYPQALAQGAGLGSEIGGRLNQKTIGRPLHIYLSELALNQIRAGSAGQVFTTGAVQRMVLSVEIASDRNVLLLDGFGEGRSLPSPSLSPLAASNKADQALLAGIPADAAFVRLGGNLAQDIEAWESLTHVLDTNVLEQSAVASLLNQLTGPYAYYQRLGEDGVEDVGLLVAIPPEIAPPIALGDAALEQTLPALTPLILPVKPVSLPAFADGVYEGVPLRFANLAGSAKALDYTVKNNLITLSTSKEGMFSALDVAGKKIPSLEASAPWQTLLAAWGPVPATPQFLLGHLNFSSVLDLLPTAQTSLPFGLTQETAVSGLHFSGVLML